ncbi:ABC-three component system middle component 6 [Priestia megaterium]|uniref:ABC-three component system middle component 6 n=1 Tax=Priestia megaterium TaxID=1404 RepID=UPI003AB4B381
MILPNKFIKPNDSLIGIGALILPILDKPITVSFLWDKARKQEIVKTFNNFISALDLLFLLGAIKLENGLIKRC